MEENKPQPNNNEGLKTIRTYLGDMAETVRSNEIDVIKVALAEQNKHEREDLYRKIEGSPTKKVFWFIGGIIFIATAIYGVYFVLNKKAAENAPEQIVKEVAIVSYDENKSIDIQNVSNLSNEIINLKNETGESVKTNFIKYISISKTTNEVKEKISINDLFSDLNFNAPLSFVRTIDDYMIGSYVKNNSDPKLFIILHTKDYEYAYAGMLEWEATLASDMFDLFQFKTQLNKLQLNEKQWKDVLINNKDARVLFDEEGNPLLFYLFADKGNLVIAQDENTIKEIISRLIIKNIKPL